MLLAIWRWTVALTADRTPWAAAGWMLLSAMTYEAGVILPVVLVCLFPIARKRLGVTWRSGVRKMVPLLGVLAVFFVLRGLFLGRLVGYTDAAGPDLQANFLYQLDMLRRLYPNFGNMTALWILGAALVATSFIPGFFPAGPCLLLAAIALLLRYINAAGAGERFYYMMQAPLSVVAVLPALIFAKWLRPIFLAALLVLVVPHLVFSAWRESVLYAVAGMKTEALIAAIHRAIPVHDGWADVIDGVPELDDVRPMMGGYFETGITDSYVGDPRPYVVRGEAVLASPQLLTDILRISTRYWHYDVENQRLVRMEKADWLDAHPEARASLPR